MRYVRTCLQVVPFVSSALEIRMQPSAQIHLLHLPIQDQSQIQFEEAHRRQTPAVHRSAGDSHRRKTRMDLIFLKILNLIKYFAIKWILKCEIGFNRFISVIIFFIHNF